MSDESEQGNGRELVSELWAEDRNWDGSLGWSRAEEGCHLEVGVKIPLMVTGGATEEAVRSLSKAEETEV